MKSRLVIVWLLLAGLAPALRVRAADRTCAICGQLIIGKYYQMEDHAEGGKTNVCRDCADLDERCFACGLPVKQDFKTLPDGRYLCARDSKEAIVSEEEVRRICEGVRDELNHTYWRFMTFPTNTSLAVVDKFQLQNLFKTPGYEHACVTVFGATMSAPFGKDKFVHSVSLLSHLRKSRLMAVCAHEFTHTWLNENLSKERRFLIDSKAQEGFCELIAYHYMESKQEKYEMEVIKSSDYTRGQIKAMLEAESTYGFNTVIEWMKTGEDAKLDIHDLGRVRAVRADLVASNLRAPNGLLSFPTAAPPPLAPDHLILKGISGSGQHRLAIINDRTFEALERGKVRIGQTNALIRCLEIRQNSVVIQAEGAKDKQELFLKAD